MKNMLLISIQKHWLMLALFMMLSLLGYYSWTKLALEAYPDIADVTSQVVTQVPGLAAEEVEQQITIPVERALNGMPGMEVMRSKSTFGLSMVTIVFKDGTNDYFARNRIEERLKELSLPYGAIPGLDPLTSPTGEIYRYIIEGKQEDLRKLTDLQNWVIIPRLKQVSGVADVTNFGGITTQYQVELDPAKLDQYHLSTLDVEEAIQKNNANAGGSTLNVGEQGYVVRGIGLIQHLEDMGRIVIKTEKGVPVLVSDLGDLKYGNLERKGILGYTDRSRNYSESLEGIVLLLKGENPSEVLKGVHKAVEELNNGLLPEGVVIHPFLDRTDLVNTTLKTVSHTLIEGMVLVIVVLIVFLGSWRAALLVAITIPISLLIAFILMKLTDIPANLLSLGAIDFGILVDGAIVMMETILKKRESDPEAALKEKSIAKRAMKVAKPIIFSTLIIITAYLPLFAFERVEKKLFTPMAFTIAYALLAALAVALVLIPGLAYLTYRKPQKLYQNKWLEKLTNQYERILNRIMMSPRRVFLPLFLVLCAGIALSVTVGKDFLPVLDEGSIWLQVQLPPGVTLDKARERSDTLRNRTMQHPEVSYMMVQAGRNDDGTDPFTASHFECSIGLQPYSQWPAGKTKEDLIAELSKTYKAMPGYTVGFAQPMIDGVMDKISGAHSELVVKIYGSDFKESRRIAEDVMRILKSVNGAVDVAIDQEPALPQLQIIADREKMAQFGLNTAEVSTLIEVAIGGKAISEVFIGDRVFEVVCRYKADSRDSPEKIGNLMLSNAQGAKIPLSQVAEVKLNTGESTITREENQRHLTVKLNVRNVDLGTLLKDARAKIDKQLKYDESKFRMEWGGQFENQSRAYSRLAVIVPLALALMFLLLYAAFGKFHQAALILGMVPLALFGGMLALNVRGMTLNVSSAVGFIALFGLAIQNGVLMMTHINQLREKSLALEIAVMEGARHRFRPILMTATVAILGLLPASLATGIGSDVQRPLATVIVYGLLFSTGINLFAVPALYYLLERKAESRTQRSKTGAKRLVVLLFISVFSGFAGNAHAQVDTTFNPHEITYPAFLKMVSQQNIGYAAAQFNVSIATADALSAKVFPDPEFNLSAGDQREGGLRKGFELISGISYQLELAGKRKARVKLANGERRLSELSANDYFRQLRMEATVAYLKAMKEYRLLQVKTNGYQMMKQLSRADSLRLKSGAIPGLDVRQSRLEASSQLNEVYQQEADWKASLIQLEQLAGAKKEALPFQPAGDFLKFEREFQLPALILEAQQRRSDALVAAQEINQSQYSFRLAKSLRTPDLGLSLNATANTVAPNLKDPGLPSGTISFGMSIPLKFSNQNKGALRSADYKVQQAVLKYQQVEMQIQTEVSQAYHQYMSSRKQVLQYTSGMLNDAQKVLDGRIYSYKRGGSSFVEVLIAQRTFNEVQQSYLEILYGNAIALLELEQAAGIWDIDF
ncbi:CusA/CzcA family heavy metal efflux RND transporter [Pedobacter sp. N36a]|uniref:CusA/CzcA family heavy metal efflux RND transporter n=1 Tax=Pedobacter sp. N36a TaxID=2767996 RepID=UPI0016570495|nr:CusA/CzcA family heavy metal efflux RND transporter [Pedobacter sp. N36a]MBC8986971.1 CusA/CzcA family heavy metal efflux RND transporter [Pedobacter sp. N36a]